MEIMDYTEDVIKTLFSLDGMSALVVGASGSVGRAIAVGLAEFGANVLVTGRSRDRLVASAEEMAKLGVSCETAVCDVTDEESCGLAVKKAVDTFGRLDILVNAAERCRRFPSAGFPMEDFSQVLETNINGTFCMCKAASAYMIPNGGGKIINISSVRSDCGHMLGYAAYASSKGAVNSLTRQLATEWAKYDINVNSLSTTFVVTKETRGIYEDPKNDALFKNRIPAGRPSVPQELIGTAVYLASRASNYVTGQIICVDGGTTAS